MAKDLGKYKDRLMGLIPEERIATVDVPRPPKSVIDEFKKYRGLTPTVSDVLDSMGIAGAVSASEIKPLQQDTTIVGPAVTLRYVMERNTTTQLFAEKAKPKLADRDAYAVAEPGDVIVFDVGGKVISTQGGLSTLMAVKAKLAGNIVDGGVRDVEDIHELKYPVWARGVTPISGKYRIEAVEINGPVNIAGVQVNPGDLVIADDTGIVFIPSDKIEEVLEKTKALIAKEQKVVDAINQGANLSDFKKILPPEKW
jgi:4-hydroxy-4-methyl-2-oxoglutarate aldolase